MSKRKFFGTDGIRGKANIYPMTGELAFSLGRAVTYYFQTLSGKTRKKPLIILGKDTRLSCYMLEQAFSAGVCSQGGEVVLTGPLPTPGIAFVTKSMRANAGVMISASHNPYYDNGIKIFNSDGHKLPDAEELKLEDMVLNPDTMPLKENEELGKAKRLEEVFGRYVVHCKSALNEKFNMDGMKIVLDCANGAGYKVAPLLFNELGAELSVLGVNPNGLNINADCGSLYPEKAGALVKEIGADLGVCLDGDADRLIVVDSNGEAIDGDKIIGLFAKLLLDQGQLKPGDTVVGTVMSNMGLEVYLKELGLNFHRTAVGDRYIMEYMSESKSVLGGEPSGHIILKDHATTGDGVLASLKVVEAMRRYGKSVGELTKEMTLFPQVLKNAQVKLRPELESVPNIQKALSKAGETLKDSGRVLLRYSGTESKIRVMVEGRDRDLVMSVCDDLLKVVEAELN